MTSSITRFHGKRLHIHCRYSLLYPIFDFNGMKIKRFCSLFLSRLVFCSLAHISVIRHYSVAVDMITLFSECSLVALTCGCDNRFILRRVEFIFSAHFQCIDILLYSEKQLSSFWQGDAVVVEWAPRSTRVQCSTYEGCRTRRHLQQESQSNGADEIFISIQSGFDRTTRTRNTHKATY